MKRWWLIIPVFIPFALWAQTITTIAGGGIGADGGPATAASIYDPNGLVFDRNGNLYFSENLSHVVRKIDAFGIITTVAGTGTAGFSGDGGAASVAQLNQPTGIAVDTFGNLYIADGQNNRIRKVTVATGIISTVAGSSVTPGFSGDGGLATISTLNRPACVCFDKSGNMYIGDGDRVRKVSPSGIITTIAGNGLNGNSGDGGPATAAECYSFNMCTDNAGNLYIAEYGGYEVRKVNTGGIITTIAGDTTSYIYNGDEIPATKANMAPAFIAFSITGELYISDYNNDRVRKIDASGIIHTVVGTGVGGYSGDGGPATAAQINYPSGLAFDHCGNLYFGQVNNPHIRKVVFNPDPCPHLAVNNVATEEATSIYPNPTYDILNINNVKTESTYRLLSIVGALMQQGILKEGNNSISIQAIPNGMYMLEVTPTSLQGTKQSQEMKTITKIIKQ